MTTTLIQIETGKRANHELTSPLNLADYDLIAVSSSGGKDSSVMLRAIALLAEEQGVKDRVHVIHSTFSEEWPGADAMARGQAEMFGLKFHLVGKVNSELTGKTLLDYVEHRQKWPDSPNRFCTSDFKRGPIEKQIKALTPLSRKPFNRPYRVLDVWGLRGDESPKRAKRPQLDKNKRLSNGVRQTDTWMPIKDWNEIKVWKIIRENGIPVHYAYGLGFKRLSCRFCIYASRDTLMASALQSPELFSKYVEVEKKIGFKFTQALSLEEIDVAIKKGEKPSGPLGFSCEL